MTRSVQSSLITINKKNQGVLTFTFHFCIETQIITARKEELMDKGHVRNSMKSFLDILLQMHMQDETLTESEILDETITILGAVSFQYHLYTMVHFE